MPDDPTREAPLSASIGEQLEEKRTLDEQAGAERQAAQQEEARTERHKAEERADVARHLGGPATPGRWRRWWERARQRGRKGAWLRDRAPLLALPVAAAGGFALARWVGRRRGGLPLALPLFAWVLWPRRVPAG